MQQLLRWRPVALPAAPAPEAVVDRVLPAAAVLLGPLPPETDKLRLLVRSEHAAAVEGVLARAGLVRRGPAWAPFRGETPFTVEIVPSDRYGLSPQEVDVLFAGAQPVHGYRSFLRPAPQHALRIRLGGAMPDRRPA